MLAIAITALQKPTYHLRIASASGETDALASTSKEHVQQIVRALNEAIVHRGS